MKLEKLIVFFLIVMKGTLEKIIPLNEEVTISGKISIFRNKYQITNPTMF